MGGYRAARPGRIEAARRSDGLDRRLPRHVIAYVVAWALFAFQRMILWEIPFMPAKLVWFRAAVSVPFPFLAAAIAMLIGKP